MKGQLRTAGQHGVVGDVHTEMKTIAAGKPKVVGLTGGIAAGKSLVRKSFELLGVPCVDFDVIARALHQDPAHPATREISAAFPDWMTENGALQRGSLQGLFARNADANQTLIGILRPHVLEAIHTWTFAQRAPYVVWESALLLQEEIAVDRLLIVDAPEALRIERIRRRNPDWSEQHIENILAMQAASFAKAVTHFGVACDAIHNDNAPQALHAQVESMHRQYTTLWS